MIFTKKKEMIEAYWSSKRKIKDKFLWFPVTINGETRWLEKATIEYRVDCERDLVDNKYYFWKPINFIEENE
jgi:hypothetical protein